MRQEQQTVHIFDLAMRQGESFFMGVPTIAATTLADLLGQTLPLHPHFSQASVLQTRMYRELAVASPERFLVEDHIPEQCRAAILFPKFKGKAPLYVALGEETSDGRYKINRRGSKTTTLEATQYKLLDFPTTIDVTQGAFFIILSWNRRAGVVAAYLAYGKVDKEKGTVVATHHRMLGIATIPDFATIEPTLTELPTMAVPYVQEVLTPNEE